MVREDREIRTELGNVSIHGSFNYAVYVVTLAKIAAVESADNQFCLLCENSEEVDKELGAELHDSLAMALYNRVRDELKSLIDFLQEMEEMKLFEGEIVSDTNW